jgi:TPR repeat protein
MPNAMIDLHGLSVTQAEQAVQYWLSTAYRTGYTSIRFVTGRGNHINKNGTSGVLYKSFLSWIEKFALKETIESCKQYDGYFEVKMKPSSSLSQHDSFFKESVNKFIHSNIPEIIAIANSGEPYFQMLYATLLEQGDGVTQSFSEAARYYRLSADQNYPAAMHSLARCYLHGVGVRQNDKTAFTWLEKAAKLEDPESALSVGDCYWKGLGTQQDVKIAVTYYTKAAIWGNSTAMRKVANAYGCGLGVTENKQSSFMWYKRSADLGDAISQHNVGAAYLNGTGIEPDEIEAFKYLKLSADGGDSDAQCNLGLCYLQGTGTQVDRKQALFWLKKASSNGSAQASNVLSRIGDEKDRQDYLNKSAQSGNFLDKVVAELTRDPSKKLNDEQFDALMDNEIRKSFELSHNDIVLLTHESKFILIDTMLKDKKPKYWRKALEALHAMASQSCIFSLRRLIKIYVKGVRSWNIKSDLAKVKQYLDAAIKEGDTKSMVLMGQYHESGEIENIPKSPDAALKMYQMAARKNNPTACCHLGIFYMRYEPPNGDFNIIMNCFERAIALEADHKVLKDLSSGLVDEYSPVTQNARTNIAVLRHAIKMGKQMANGGNSDDEDETESNLSGSTNKPNNLTPPRSAPREQVLKQAPKAPRHGSNPQPQDTQATTPAINRSISIFPSRTGQGTINDPNALRPPQSTLANISVPAGNANEQTSRVSASRSDEQSTPLQDNSANAEITNPQTNTELAQASYWSYCRIM